MSVSGQGWADLLKHFLTSKLSSAALFLATGLAVVGPHFTDKIPSTPPTFLWAVFILMTFTGAQCAWWIITASADSTRHAVRKLKARLFRLTISKVTKDEALVIAILGEDRFLSAEIYELSGNQLFEEPSLVMLAVKSLEAYGIVEVRRGRVTLTTAGQKFLTENREHFGAPLRKNAYGWMG